MVHDPDLLDRLEALGAGPWGGTVFRHMFGDVPPDRENRSGARWNPLGVAAIYTSLRRETAFAEAEFQIRLQPVRPTKDRFIYEIRVSLARVVDLSDPAMLEAFGVGPDELVALDQARCRAVGGAAEYLGYDGLLVPSARAAGANLVIYPHHQDDSFEFEVIRRELAASVEREHGS